MLKRVSEVLNKEVSYVREVYTEFFYFDDIQYLLKDNDDNQYLLVMSYDDNDRQPGYLWLKKVDRLMWRLYNYPLSKKLHKVKNKKIEYNIICEDIGKSVYIDGFSLNRFDLIYPNNKNYVLRYNEEVLMISIENDKAIVGTWNSFIKRTTFLAIVNNIFSVFKNVKSVEYKNAIFNTCFDSHYWRHPDFYLPLPRTIEELESNLSSKGRHNIKREKRIIEDEFGSLELLDVEYHSLNQEIIELFYEYKNHTHKLDDDYDIKNKHITNVYCLKCGNDIKGVLLSCEQSAIAFIENHTFDSSLKRFSFGQVMYDMYLNCLIEKKKKGLSLAGGNLDYKKRYGSICFNSYSGSIKRKSFRLYNYLVSSNYKIDSWLYHKLSVLQTLFKNR